MRRSFGLRRGLVGVTTAVAALVIVPLALASATNSTSDPGQTVGGVTSGDCVHPAAPTPVNCNDYTQKQDVFLNGSPSKSDAGTYFFAVLVPGGQPNPNDGGQKNLSDDTCAPYTCPAANLDGSAIPTGDPALNREFSVAANGKITNLGGHLFDSAGNGGLGSLSVFPFDDTTNNGGVYILASCKISDSQSSDPIPVPTVAPHDCKYDAFKVEASQTTPPGTASDLVVTKDASGADTNTFTWGIQKGVDQSEIDDSAGSAQFNYTVTVTHDSGTVSGVSVSGTIQVFNPNVDMFGNTVPVDITGVADQLSNGTNCAVTDGGPQTLTQTETDFAYTCNLSSLPQGELDNTVTVTWSSQMLSNGDVLAGNLADFTFTGISFTETKVDDCASVSDTLGGSLGTVCSTDPSPTTFMYPLTFTDPAGTCTTHANTASFVTDTTGATGSAQQSVKQCVGEDLQVNKTAATSYRRTYNWSINKSVDKTTASTSGSSATFNYTVVVAQTGFTDSAIQATGTITVTNPNDWEPVTLTGVTDSVDNGGTCNLTTGDSPTATIPAGGSVHLNYTCTYSAPLPGNGTNTATASWDPVPAFTPDGSKQGTAPVTFGSPSSTVNKMITPTDAFNSGSAVHLCSLTSTPSLFCTLTGADMSPLTSHTYTYSRTIPATTDRCVNYTNIAATGTGPTSTKTVTVCGPAAGGLTMGFWQNKNGQGIITGQAKNGVCPSATWLRLYAPFQDLSASATCAGVASYVSGVIGNATCGSLTCNAMLKAQMLSTALDVYFSDPALGGDKILAFNGGNNVALGGVNVDLTKVYGSENASAAFNAPPMPTCQTVNQLLTYAAGQSNLGGSIWYGQVKTTQTLAKDTFDAINNQNVPVC